jgi:hypothetical protein
MSAAFLTLDGTDRGEGTMSPERRWRCEAGLPWGLSRARGSGAGGMKLIYINGLNEGGHFAAWERPALFTAEMCAAFRPLRQSI